MPYYQLHPDQSMNFQMNRVLTYGEEAGAKTPFAFYQQLTLHTMKGISHRVQQDVFLLAGQKDHYIPLEQFYQQQRALVNAHSLTARLFTVSEGGEQHCQVGHHQLALDAITRWLDAFTGGSPSRSVQLRADVPPRSPSKTDGAI